MTAAITTTAPRPTLEELVVRLIDAIFGDGALEVRAMLGMRWRPGRLVTRWAGWSRPAASSSGDGAASARASVPSTRRLSPASPSTPIRSGSIASVEAQRYLTSRSISPPAARRLGLRERLQALGFGDERLEASGLLSGRGERFRGMVVIPELVAACPRIECGDARRTADQSGSRQLPTTPQNKEHEMNNGIHHNGNSLPPARTGGTGTGRDPTQSSRTSPCHSTGQASSTSPQPPPRKRCTGTPWRRSSARR